MNSLPPFFVCVRLCWFCVKKEGSHRTDKIERKKNKTKLPWDKSFDYHLDISEN